jgi:predicted lipid-binding transport protein (Tim44 family)
MKKTLMAALVLAFGLGVGSAEAARIGAGKSVGMQRQSVAQKPAAPAQATPAAPAAPAAAPAAAPKRNWMGPLAGLAAGVGIAALFSSMGMGGAMGGAMGNILMIALLAGAAFFVFKLLSRRKASAAQAAGPMQFAGLGNLASMAPPPETAPLFGSAAPAVTPVVPVVQRVPDGFDSAGFLRVAKLNFIRLQAANDAKNLDDMREFVGPEMFAEIKMQMDERGNAPQTTDVVTLEAELIEATTEANRHIASVHFKGMIREVTGTAAVSFNEVWNLSKPVEGSQGWVISGIQQLN